MPSYRSHQHFIDVCLFLKFKYSIGGLNVERLKRLNTDIFQKNQFLIKEIKDLKEVKEKGLSVFLEREIEETDSFLKYHLGNCNGRCEFCVKRIPNM